MDNEIKILARQQFFKYFKIWFIITAVLAVITVIAVAIRLLTPPDTGERTNMSAPVERVFDYADVLTPEEEQTLSDYIAEKEKDIKADIVLVTINEVMEKDGKTWENAMMNYADDFYDHNNYGYDAIHGDGLLILDNYYEGQAGTWLSTCGSVYENFGDYEINEVLDAVYYGLDDGAFNAYREGIYTACEYMEIHTAEPSAEYMSWGTIILFPLIVAAIYFFVHVTQRKAKVTTTSTTYVSGGKPVMNVSRDDFLRKSVVTRKIETSSSSSGGSRSSGGRGGSHRSSSGVRHGGGGRRR